MDKATFTKAHKVKTGYSLRSEQVTGEVATAAQKIKIYRELIAQTEDAEMVAFFEKKIAELSK